jgi:hypothetical protein
MVYVHFISLFPLLFVFYSCFRYDKLPGEWYGPSTAAFVLRDLTKLHRRKHTGELEVYVTTGDTIYISDVNKLCTCPGVGAAAAGKSVAATADSLATLKSSLSAAMLRAETVSGTSADHPLDSSSGTTAKLSTPDAEPTPFFDPLLHVPPNSSTEKPWNCSLLVVVPLKLGVYNVSEAYREEVKKVLRHRNSVGILGGRPNHAIYFFGYSTPTGARGVGAGAADAGAVAGTQLLGLDPHTVYSTNHYTTEPFPSPELCAQIHPAVVPNFSSFDQNIDGSSASGSTPCSSATSSYEAQCCPPASLPIEQLDPSIALGFYFRTKAEFEVFCAEKTNKPKPGSGNNSSVFSMAAAVGEAGALKGGASATPSTPSILYNIEYAEPTYDFSMYDQEDDDNMDQSGCGGGGDGAGDGGGNDDDKDDEYVFI